jgi:membrane-associated HD superfamily phosphohydrolase
MSDHSEEAIATMVNKIIDGQVADGLLRETPISFRDVETVKQLFVERLRTAYHARISYPGDTRPQTDTAATDAGKSPEETK